MNFVRTLTLRQLQIFVVAARHLSYARAAEELHLSPPAVSMQLRQLEDNVGLPLFERLGRGVTLTDACRFHNDEVEIGRAQDNEDLSQGVGDFDPRRARSQGPHINPIAGKAVHPNTITQ